MNTPSRRTFRLSPSLFLSVLVATLPLTVSLARAQCPGDSLFHPGGHYSAGLLPRSVVVADFNGDAISDLAVANSEPSALTVSLVFGQGASGSGDGTFHPGVEIDAGGEALGIVTGDFNGDRIHDLAVANGSGGAFSILLGQGQPGVGDGSFGAPIRVFVGVSIVAVVRADFNADGIDDLAFIDVGLRRIHVLLGGGSSGIGDGTFGSRSYYPLTSIPTALAAKDIDRDGITDLVVLGRTPGTLAVLMGRGTAAIGDGTFGSPVYYAAGASPADLAIEDFDGDEVLDVAVADKSGGGIQVFAGAGNGALRTPVAFAGGLSVSSVLAFDADDDGIRDLIAATAPGDQIVLLRGSGSNGSGDGSFAAPVFQGATGPYPIDLARGDFNDDGAQDVVAACYNSIQEPPSGISIHLGRCALATGALSPELLSARDEPADEGGRVRLTWSRSDFDGVEGARLSGYRIWRRMPPTVAIARPIVTTRGHDRVLTDWEPVAEFAARETERYSHVAPTTRDSVAGDSAPHEFFVRAQTSNPDVFFDSGVLVAHSVDELAPAPPTHLIVESRTQDGVPLHWDRSAASDVQEYRIYRGADPFFVPGISNRIAVVRDTHYVDPGRPPPGAYKASAVDRHGNEGPVRASAECTTLTGSFVAGDPISHVNIVTTAARFDTSYSAPGAGHSGRFDNSTGRISASASAGQYWWDVGTTTTSRDMFFLAGTTTADPVTFSARLSLWAVTFHICGYDCSGANAIGTITEVGGSTSSWQTYYGGGTVLSIPITRRAVEPFQLELTACAGAFAYIFEASASIDGVLSFADLPAGAYVRSCHGYVSDLATPVQVSLLDARIRDGAAVLTWYSADASVQRATVYRHDEGSDWSEIGAILPDGTGRLVYEDRDVVPGGRYGYRLGVHDGDVERMLGEAWLDVPLSSRLTLEPISPSPARGAMSVSFSLPSARPARLELFDLAGRRVAERDVGSLGAGPHRLRLDETGELAPGVYVVRLSQDGNRLSRRAVTIR